MTNDAPERIWASSDEVEYVRADLYDALRRRAEKAEAVAAERGVGMVTPLPPECAPKDMPVLVAGGIAMKKTGGQWYSGMAEPAFERPIDWDVKWWSPIPQQNVTPARANTDALAACNTRAEKEAAVAAAYEDAAQLVEQVRDERCERCGNPRHDHPYRHMFVSTGSPMRAAAAIRARGNTDALAARDARVKAEALREAAAVLGVRAGPLGT